MSLSLTNNTGGTLVIQDVLDNASILEALL
jgi:hypothetical protein